MDKVICIAGKNNIAVEIAKHLRFFYPNVKLLAIVNANDTGINSFQLSFKSFCEKNKIPLVTLKDIYQIKDLIFLSLEFDKIIRPKNFATNQLYNIHFSYLPAYKGMYTSALPIINNEKYSGVTLHKIDSGIDTGDIIDQIKFEIGNKSTGQDLYNLYIDYGIAIIKKNINCLINQNFSSKPQAIKGSSYYSKKTIDYANLEIDLNKTAIEIYNQIRAFSFPIYQLPKIHNSEIYHSVINKSNSNEKPGTIMNEDNFIIKLATIDYDITLLKDRRNELFAACKNNNLNFIKELDSKHYPIYQRSKEGWDILIIAAYHGHIEIIKWLVEEKNWDINTNNNNYTSFAMYVMTHAAKNNHFTVLKYIIENCNKINWTHKDAHGYDIYHYAKKLNNKQVIEILP